MKVLALLFLVLVHTLVIAQNDAAKIYEAEYALENKSDCKGAKAALGEVSVAGQSQSRYLYFMAKACDCLNEFGPAVDYYNKYLKNVPNDTATIKTLGRVSYELRKENRRKNLTGAWTGVTNDGDTLAFTIEQKDDEVTIKQVEHPERYFSGKYEDSYKLMGKKYGIYWKIKSATFYNDSCKICTTTHTSVAYCKIAEDGNSITLYNHSFFPQLKVENTESRNIYSKCCEIVEDVIYAVSWNLTRK